MYLFFHRKKCPDIIINDTTGGSYGMTLEQRLSCLDANPEVATLNMGPDMAKMTIKERKAPLPHPRPEIRLDTCDVNTYADISAFAKAMKERGIVPEIEIYHPGMNWVFWDLVSQGLLNPPT